MKEEEIDSQTFLDIEALIIDHYSSYSKSSNKGSSSFNGIRWGILLPV